MQGLIITREMEIEMMGEHWAAMCDELHRIQAASWAGSERVKASTQF